MKTILFSLLLLIASATTGQNLSPKESELFATDINKNIFRVMAIIADDTWPIVFSYEREIKKPFTFILKAGPSFARNDFGPSDNPYQYGIYAFASGELRYYYNLRKRIRKQKKVRNFSSIYLSLEQNVQSGAIAVINQSRHEALDGSSGTFINIGYQVQFGQGYFNAFFGPKMNISDLKQGIVSADTFHVGIALGIVLFE